MDAGTGQPYSIARWPLYALEALAITPHRSPLTPTFTAHSSPLTPHPSPPTPHPPPLTAHSLLTPDSSRLTPHSSRLTPQPHLTLTNARSAQAYVPASVNQYLRQYQKEGVQFLWRQYAADKGGLLGDEMGAMRLVIGRDWS